MYRVGDAALRGGMRTTGIQSITLADNPALLGGIHKSAKA